MRIEGRSIERDAEERAFLSLAAVSGATNGAIPLLPLQYTSVQPIYRAHPSLLPGYRSDEDEALRVVESKRRGGRQGVTVYGPISDCVEPVVLGARNRG